MQHLRFRAVDKNLGPKNYILKQYSWVKGPIGNSDKRNINTKGKKN